MDLIPNITLHYEDGCPGYRIDNIDTSAGGFWVSERLPGYYNWYVWQLQGLPVYNDVYKWCEINLKDPWYLKNYLYISSKEDAIMFTLAWTNNSQ